MQPKDLGIIMHSSGATNGRKHIVNAPYIPYIAGYFRGTNQGTKSLFTVGVWSNEPLTSKIKSTKCFVENNLLYDMDNKLTK